LRFRVVDPQVGIIAVFSNGRKVMDTEIETDCGSARRAASGSGEVAEIMRVPDVRPAE